MRSVQLDDDDAGDLSTNVSGLKSNSHLYYASVQSFNPTQSFKLTLIQIPTQTPILTLTETYMHTQDPHDSEPGLTCPVVPQMLRIKLREAEPTPRSERGRHTCCPAYTAATHMEFAYMRVRAYILHHFSLSPGTGSRGGRHRNLRR